MHPWACRWELNLFRNGPIVDVVPNLDAAVRGATTVNLLVILTALLRAIPPRHRPPVSSDLCLPFFDSTALVGNRAFESESGKSGVN